MTNGGGERGEGELEGRTIAQHKMLDDHAFGEINLATKAMAQDIFCGLLAGCNVAFCNGLLQPRLAR